jgi:hypothetical protein
MQSMSEDDFCNKILEAAKLLNEINQYALSPVIDFFIEDLNDIEIDDAVWESICNGKKTIKRRVNIPKHKRLGFK